MLDDDVIDQWGEVVNKGWMNSVINVKVEFHY